MKQKDLIDELTAQEIATLRERCLILAERLPERSAEEIVKTAGRYLDFIFAPITEKPTADRRTATEA
jgi:hypothetical protein